MNDFDTIVRELIDRSNEMGVIDVGADDVEIEWRSRA